MIVNDGAMKFFPNDLIQNVKIQNPENGENPEHKNPESLA
jgi:hypothetical protein